MYIDILYLKKLKQLLILNGGSTNTKTSLSGSGSVIDIVIKIGNLRTLPVECHGDDTSLMVMTRMESDRIRMESDSDITFYHILTRIRIRIRMLSDTMQNGCLEFGYLLDLEHSYIVCFIHYKHISKVSLSHYTIRNKD